MAVVVTVPDDVPTKEQLAAVEAVVRASLEAVNRVNAFCADVLQTRGGRIGSGMGLLLEAMWGYQVNAVIREQKIAQCELAWFPSHQYHDFACVTKSRDWNAATKEGELFLVEAKSMNADADESKAHFDVLRETLDEEDRLVLLVWKWKKLDEWHMCPVVISSFIGAAKPIAELRDALHLARGGSFVDADHCPDGCQPADCGHGGEPLNAQGKRERLTGPEVTRPSNKVSFASNFGGLLRMLKSGDAASRATFRQVRKASDVAHAYISFIYEHYPNEELNQYTTGEWRKIAMELGVPFAGRSKAEIQADLRRAGSDYQALLRNL